MVGFPREGTWGWGEEEGSKGRHTDNNLPFSCSFSFFLALPLQAGSALPSDPGGHVFSLPASYPRLSGLSHSTQPLTPQVGCDRSRVTHPWQPTCCWLGPLRSGASPNSRKTWSSLVNCILPPECYPPCTPLWLVLVGNVGTKWGQRAQVLQNNTPLYPEAPSKGGVWERRVCPWNTPSSWQRQGIDFSGQGVN